MSDRQRGVEVCGGDYEHVLGFDREVDGIGLRYVIHPLNQLFERMIAERAFEVCEFSLSNYLMLRDRGADWLTAVPIFPYRAFRHSTLFVRGDNPLESLSDLAGKRVAVPDYSMTAAVWTRGILSTEAGLSWSDIRWVSGRKQRFSPPAGVDLTLVDDDPEALTISGGVDALLTTGTEDGRLPPAQRKLRPLLRDAVGAEEAYHRRTGIYPINHVIVVRADALARQPDLPAALFKAYTAAKAEAYRRRLSATLLPWGGNYWNRMFEAFGGDPLPYGFTGTNAMVVRKLADFLFDQKLIAARPDIESLFAPGSLAWRG